MTTTLTVTDIENTAEKLETILETYKRQVTSLAEIVNFLDTENKELKTELEELRKENEFLKLEKN